MQTTQAAAQPNHILLDDDEHPILSSYGFSHEDIKLIISCYNKLDFSTSDLNERGNEKIKTMNYILEKLFPKFKYGIIHFLISLHDEYEMKDYSKHEDTISETNQTKQYSGANIFEFDDNSCFSYYPEMTIDELNQESPSLVMDIGQCISFHSKKGERRWIEMNEDTTLEELFEGFIHGKNGLKKKVFYKHREIIPTILQT